MSSEKALKLKDEGNGHLKEHRYDEAIACYTQAIELDGSNPVFYSNRAQVHIKVENYGLAISDCNEALKADKEFSKAYYRRGVSLMAILNYKEAQVNFKEVLKRVPNDRLTLENHKQCTNFLKKAAFEKAIAGDSRTSIIAQIDFDGMLVEKTWDGPELTVQKDGDRIHLDGLDENYVQYMLQVFKDGGRLPKKHVFAIVAKACDLFRSESTLTEISMRHKHLQNGPQETVVDARKITVCGDTHGQFYDVLNLFERFGPVSDDHVYLFNGDFVDRGLWLCEVALYLYALKILHPTAMYINRGNHETNDMNRTYGFADECEHKYSKKVFEAFAELFGALPLAALVNQQYLVMHGGLFSDDKVSLNDIRRHNRFPASGLTQPTREGIAMELLWTDPQPENGRAPSKRGLGMQFGPDVTERFCLANKIHKIIRSHEVRMGGVEEEHNGRLITVFSAPNYCDATGNLGGVVHVTANESYDASADDGEGFRRVDDKTGPWTLSTETFEAVEHPDIKPMAYSKSGFGF